MVKFLEHETYDSEGNDITEKIPVSISFSAIKNFQKHTGKSISEVSEDLEDLFHLLYFSYVAGCKITKNKGFKVKYELEDFEPVFDGTMDQFTKVIPEFFPAVAKGKKK